MSKKAKQILIAEDEVSISRALKLKLEALGNEVTVVGDGQLAVNELLSKEYDLLLLDLMMPEKDGFEVMEEVRANNISVPIIVSSNLSQEIDKERAQELGAVDFFVKSNTSLAEVVEHVNKQLNM